jgi:hypothetical protein
VAQKYRQLNPYKILCVILFAETDFITWNSPTAVEVRLGPLSRAVGQPNYRVRDYLRWLEHTHYVADLDLQYGKASFTVNLPKRSTGT